MKRIDIVYEKLKQLSARKGISTIELSDALGLSRANVSSDLNKLCAESKAFKEGIRPILYKTVQNSKQESAVDKESTVEKEKITALDKFALRNPSLFSAIEQSKAAILYPPKGMPILILGETGTGKSMFAGLIQKYAVEMSMMKENAPFVVFNCSDYANNPQLLLGQLFGSKKGAYTGADADKPGLIEKANEGILFLDEVHRLPPEGQEMFFTFMDKGTYRRLGETESERTAKVLIISATTENPDSSLLKTFTRRIPMIIRIPNLGERSLEERLNLISDFMREESSRLGRPVSVSLNSMRAFTGYHCPNNVGQLKTDIQLACAKAYADFISFKKEDIRINSIDMPPYIREGLYMETGHRQLWNKLIGINKRYCIFDKSKESILFEEEENEDNIYEMIDLRVHELRSKGVSNEELEREMEKDIEDYFSKYIRNANKNVSLSSLKNVIGAEIINVVEEIVKFSEERLQKVFSPKILYGLAVHIANSIERIKRNKKIINPQLNKIRMEHSREFNVAIDCLDIISRDLDIVMPIDEAGFLAGFFILSDGKIKEQKEYVKIIVIAHGTTTATSMTEAANSLLGEKYAAGINAPLDEKPQQVMSRLKNYLMETEDKSDILLLVDMGSLTNFGKEIEKELGIKTKTIPLVSTLHVLEAVRKAMMGQSLEEVYNDTMKVNELLDNEMSAIKDEAGKQKKMAIVTMCTSGEGSAVAIKRMLQQQLEFDRNLLEIIPLNIIGGENIYARLKDMGKKYKILCIASSFHLDTDILQVSIEEVLNKKAAVEIQNLIDIETVYINLGCTLENHLVNIDGKTALKDIQKFIKNIEIDLDSRMDTNRLIGIAIHIGYMIDKLKEGIEMDKFAGKEKFISENSRLYFLIKRECEVLNKKYQVSIPEDEICCIMMFFNQQIL